MKIISKNKRAFFDYEILEEYTAGLVLTGDEIKSIRKSNTTLQEAFGRISNGKPVIINWHIGAYEHAYTKTSEARRTRSLLLRKEEIRRIIGKVTQKGCTIIPLLLFLGDRGYAKMKIGLGKHKNLVDKRESIKRRETDRETARAIKGIH